MRASLFSSASSMILPRAFLTRNWKIFEMRTHQSSVWTDWSLDTSLFEKKRIFDFKRTIIAKLFDVKASLSNSSELREWNKPLQGMAPTPTSKGLLEHCTLQIWVWKIKKVHLEYWKIKIESSTQSVTKVTEITALWAPDRAKNRSCHKMFDHLHESALHTEPEHPGEVEHHGLNHEEDGNPLRVRNKDWEGWLTWHVPGNKSYTGCSHRAPSCSSCPDNDMPPSELYKRRFKVTSIDHVTWILASDWSVLGHVTWSLISDWPYWSRDLNTGFWLTHLEWWRDVEGGVHPAVAVQHPLVHPPVSLYNQEEWINEASCRR